jgi:hypothetical protein
MPERMYLSLRRLLFLFENIFSILFYIIMANFKVLDMTLERFVYVLVVNGKCPNFLEKVLYI